MLTINMLPDTPDEHLGLVGDLVQTAIAHGAWTMAEALGPVMIDPRTRDIPFQWSDDPPTITLVGIDPRRRNILEPAKAPFEDVTGKPGEPNILEQKKG